MSSFIPTGYGTTGNANAIEQSPYLFPILKLSAIIDILQDLISKDITKADLVEPQRSKEKIRKIFWYFLEEYRGISEEKLSNWARTISHVRDEDGTTRSKFSHPELQESALINTLFFRELSSLLHACRLYDFSMRDVHSPTSTRMRCVMSALINFAKYEREKSELLAALMVHRSENLLELENCISKNAERMEELYVLEKENDSKLEHKHEIEKRCHELEGDLARINKSQSEVRKSNEKLKREISVLEEKLDETQWQLSDLEHKEEELRSKVVSSPVRRKNEVVAKKEQLANLKADIRGLQAELQSSTIQIENVKRATKAVAEMTTLQGHVLADTEKLDHAARQVEYVKKSVEVVEEKIDTIQSDSAEIERTIQRKEEKLAHMREQVKAKMDAAQKDIDALKERLLREKGDHRDNIEELETLQAEAGRLERLLHSEVAKADNEISSLVNEYKVVERAILEQLQNRINLCE